MFVLFAGYSYYYILYTFLLNNNSFIIYETFSRFINARAHLPVHTHPLSLPLSPQLLLLLSFYHYPLTVRTLIASTVCALSRHDLTKQFSIVDTRPVRVLLLLMSCGMISSIRVDREGCCVRQLKNLVFFVVDCEIFGFFCNIFFF